MSKSIYFVGRLLLSLIFLMSAIGKIADFAGTAAFMRSAGMTVATEFFLVAAIVLLLVGSLSVISGKNIKIGVAALFLFLVPATLIFHHDLADKMQMILFMKNLSIMGGLLLVLAPQLREKS